MTRNFVPDWQKHLKSYQVPTVLKETCLAPLIFSLVEKPERLLDIGCGTGYFTEKFANTGIEVTGVDSCGDYFPTKSNNVTYLVMNATELEISTPGFNAILIINVLSCIGTNEERTTVLKKAASVKKKGGKIYVVHGSEEVYDTSVDHDLLKTKKIGENIEWNAKQVNGKRIVFTDNIIRNAGMKEITKNAGLSIVDELKVKCPGIEPAIYDLYIIR